MKGLKKNLIYWGYSFERIALAMLVGIVFYFVMMCFVQGDLGSENAGIEAYTQSLLGYLWIFACIGIFINGFTAALSYYPMSIFLGSSRRASFWAMQIMQHLVMLQYLLLGAAAYYVLDRTLFFDLRKMVFTMIGGGLALLALSHVTCICSAKFGRIAGIVVYIVSVILITVAAVILVVSGEGAPAGYEQIMQDILRKPYVFIGALMVDGITMWLYYLVVKKQDLQS